MPCLVVEKSPCAHTAMPQGGSNARRYDTMLRPYDPRCHLHLRHDRPSGISNPSLPQRRSEAATLRGVERRRIATVRRGVERDREGRPTGGAVITIEVHSHGTPITVQRLADGCAAWRWTAGLCWCSLGLAGAVILGVEVPGEADVLAGGEGEG